MTLRAEFERCWSFLAPAVAAYGPTHDKQHVWERIEAGEAHLFPMPNAAMVVELKRWPTGFKEAVAWLAGGSGDEIETFTPRIEAWARAEGCHRAAIMAGRPGWQRRRGGYRMAGVYLTKDL